jgi:hypothetical protein
MNSCGGSTTPCPALRMGARGDLIGPKPGFLAQQSRPAGFVNTPRRMSMSASHARPLPAIWPCCLDWAMDLCCLGHAPLHPVCAAARGQLQVASRPVALCRLIANHGHSRLQTCPLRTTPRPEWDGGCQQQSRLSLLGPLDTTRSLDPRLNRSAV